MIYTFSDRRPVPQLANEVENLHRLARDLERIRDGKHPDERTLADAPIIHDWSLAERPTVALVGKMRGHPTVGDGHSARTSDLFFLAPELGYARTFNRFYALGRRHLISDRWDFL